MRGLQRSVGQRLQVQLSANAHANHISGAENALDTAEEPGWTVASTKNEWNALFGE